MRVAVVACLSVLAACGSAEDQSSELATPAQNSIESSIETGAAGLQTASAMPGPVGCRSDEKPLYACSFGKKRVAVCEGANLVAYRYGPADAAELEIVSDGTDGRASTGFIVGGGPGGQQRSIRFKNADTEYIVYSADPGSMMEVTTPWSGLAIVSGGKVLQTKECSQVGESQALQISEMSLSLPEDSEEALGWF